MTSKQNRWFLLVGTLLGITLLAGQVGGQDAVSTLPRADQVRIELQTAGLVDVQDHLVATLASLQQIDDFPIYTMTYFGPYVESAELVSETDAAEFVTTSGWGCSLFAALGDLEKPLFGRNFDWDRSPLLITFLEPIEGYRSAISVDLAYLFSENDVRKLESLSADKLLPLLDVPWLPFDGMNERGLVIGMAAIDNGCGYSTDPGKRGVNHVSLMRELIEACATVDEAVAFFENVNPLSGRSGMCLHFLVADRTPSAALIEYRNGTMYVYRSTETEPWQLATNFPLALVSGSSAGRCWRYDRMAQALSDRNGSLSPLEAMDLLQKVATQTTQWSIVYDLSDLTMDVCPGGDFSRLYRFSLEERAALGQTATN